ncbi:thermonuclease family protein [Halobacterium salinarum]|uniref:thermonuclease family protein n=1 Tax=Halobacterium salinarum TaxID=2242 RepID=UPI001F1D5DC4|nr:thermonuclease family protein [Halobacterium salinarum]MCF2238780.1 thermonuclease family protein [Halobacterium salinarum]
MHRRQFLTGLGISLGGVTVGSSTRARTVITDTTAATADDRVDELLFDSSAGLLAAPRTDGGDPGFLPDAQIVAAAEPTATTVDRDGNDDTTAYPDGETIPLMAVDGSVVAFAAPFAPDDSDAGSYGNEDVLLNVFDAYADAGTIYWDDGHDQFYDRASHSAVAARADTAGHTVAATTDIADAVTREDAAAAVVTSPADPFSAAEQDALAAFAADGGLVVLMSQSDYKNYDATASLNDLADGIDTTIRFNDTQVTDDQHNAGAAFAPTTATFPSDDHASLLAARTDGTDDVTITADETYTVDVVRVTDGDTVDVRFRDGTTDTVRIVGIDTPETGQTTERVAEYEGITDAAALKARGDAATAYARDALGGQTVTLSFDAGGPARGDYGRLLGYLTLPDGTTYNRRAVADGVARVYASAFSQYDDYWAAEATARAAGDGLWELSDPTAIGGPDSRSVESLFFPDPVAVTGGQTVVTSADSTPLVTADAAARVAAVGGPLIDEGFEPAESDGAATNEGHDVSMFVAELIDCLAADGLSAPVLVDGGHGQFGSDAALSAEDVAYFQRFLEGWSPAGVDLDGVTTLPHDTGPALCHDDGTPAASALIVSSPTTAFTAAERRAVADFADAGGAVILIGSAADTDALARFAPLTDALDTTVGFTTTPVTDRTHNLGGDPARPTTTALTEPAAVLGSNATSQ